MRDFINIYYEIKQSHSKSQDLLNSSISFIDITNVQKRLERKGENAYNNYLTEWEYSYLNSLKIPKRRTDFLSGRLAGKRAVKRHFSKNCNGNKDAVDSLQFGDIEIKRTVTGRPLVFIKDGSRNGSNDYLISLSHTDRVAASIVCNKDECKGIGIDIEKIEKRDNTLLNVAFTEDEIIKLKQRSLDRTNKTLSLFDYQLNRLWSIKEAVLKSMGVGVNIDLKDVEIVDICSGETSIILKNEAKDRYELLEGQDLKVESYMIDNYMVAISCLY